MEAEFGSGIDETRLRLFRPYSTEAKNVTLSLTASEIRAASST